MCPSTSANSCRTQWSPNDLQEEADRGRTPFGGDQRGIGATEDDGRSPAPSKPPSLVGAASARRRKGSPVGVARG